MLATDRWNDLEEWSGRGLMNLCLEIWKAKVDRVPARIEDGWLIPSPRPKRPANP